MKNVFWLEKFTLTHDIFTNEYLDEATCNYIITN